MNAVEIEAAVSDLAEAPFDPEDFPYAFLAAFGNKDTTIARLRKGDTNKSDVPGGVLQRNNIHLATCSPGQVNATLNALRASLETAKGKVKFILATDGDTLEAEEMASGETIACEYAKFAGHFGFFLPLAGISTIKEIKDSAVDVRATGRLNKLYLELLRENPDWATDERRQDMNHFMARLIFCFFAEDTGIFDGRGLFTKTVDRMSDAASGNTHDVISTIFHAMNVPTKDGSARAKAKIPGWADVFPYVNGGLFGGSNEVPRFTRMARQYLLHAGNLDWHEINPDIFGSMIQAVADDEERGALGMHYTSVPNILKVLNPLFLDDLRAQLEAAGDNKAKLLNLRKRMARIRVFDPACGSGNFLVIAYKQMREIEAEVNRRREELDLRSVIPLTNFRGIELRSFPAEIARLALIIAEYQCDVLYRGQMQAVQDFLPLEAENWITCHNALELDWLGIFPPKKTGVKVRTSDLFGTSQDQAEIDFESEGGETYICGNPPFSGSVQQTKEQKQDMLRVFARVQPKYKDLDYAAAFIYKAACHNKIAGSKSAFVSTNSVTQGEQVAMLWPLIFGQDNHISFAHRSFKWSNLATNKAVVTCVIIGLSTAPAEQRRIFDGDTERKVSKISPYLIEGDEIIVSKVSKPISDLPLMSKGNMPTDGGNLLISTFDEKERLLARNRGAERYVREYVGSREFIQGYSRWCLWITDDEIKHASSFEDLQERFNKVREARVNGGGVQAKAYIDVPHQFVYAPHRDAWNIIVPRHFSESREYITAGLVDGERVIIADSAAAIYGSSIWDLAILSSKLHLAWVATVGGRIKTDYRYSNTLCWNTFPVPLLTEQNKAELTRCAEDILLARESHFPATLADLYDPNAMPEDLRRAHERNDEVLERIYIGRRFRNDTERLEKLFDLYTKMTGEAGKTIAKPRTKGRSK
ncbi:lactate dehydrogenase [Burkholderia sp. AU30280]|uniref:class I SAM-dependent DNA methyltransferase n=1 Tax=Burkholderia sp. AU30280 TaxID=2879628 RepID=UPI001CF32FE8|nr:DNA methyltransferase [Burkholderia sp. AU30280]MCA8275041.1 lactate dehydrogenase [Burkholderia sp. AU30280]